MAGVSGARADGSTPKDETMTLKITLGSTVLRATLSDNDTARAFAAMLPMTLTLKDYHGIEKISDLPDRLATGDAPSGIDPEIGDITYYAPWGNLAIFYNDFSWSRGLVHIGNITNGIEALAAFGEGEAVFEVEE
jgi:hypothetical protein